MFLSAVRSTSKPARSASASKAAVRQRIPSPVFGLCDNVVRKEPGNAARRYMIKENEHPRGEFAAGAGTGSRLRAANSSTALICSRVMSNCSMISSTVAPASRFSNTADTGIRVSRNTHAPPSLPGTLSTAGHWDQSRVAIFSTLLFLSTTVRRRRHVRDGSPQNLHKIGR